MHVLHNIPLDWGKRCERTYYCWRLHVLYFRIITRILTDILLFEHEILHRSVSDNTQM